MHQRRCGLQLNVLEPESNAPAAVDFILSFVPPDAHDAVLPSPEDPVLHAGAKTMLHLTEELLRRATGEELLIGGRSANEAVQAIVIAEAQRVVRHGQLLPAVATAVRWAFENVPRNVSVGIVRWWGADANDRVGTLETAYACARLGRHDSGLRDLTRVLSFDQVRPRPAACLPAGC